MLLFKIQYVHNSQPFEELVYAVDETAARRTGVLLLPPQATLVEVAEVKDEYGGPFI